MRGRAPSNHEINTVGVARSEFAGFRFPPEVITVAVRGYLRSPRTIAVGYAFVQNVRDGCRLGAVGKHLRLRNAAAAGIS